MAKAKKKEGGGESRVIVMGKYELGRLLGHGSSAKVYHARDTTTGHSVAIKIFNKSTLSLKSSSSVKREISAMSRLRHPHVVSLLEVMATRAHIFLAMDLARGGELFNAAARGRFSEHLTRRCFRQLISAVSYCHSRGVFHRDLKLENLLLDHKGDIKVSDFGLCALSSSPSSSPLRTLCGTPAYVAPEILSGSAYNGAAVDVWSCGVILFALVAGYLPFNDRSLVRMYEKIGRGELRYPSWMSSSLRGLLGRVLDTNPETRMTLEGIVKDEWFVEVEEEEGWGLRREVKLLGDGMRRRTGFANAFDIISFSKGLDLSPMFRMEEGEEEVGGGLFLVEEGERESVMGRIKEVCLGGGLVVERNRGEEEGVAEMMRIGERNGDFLVGVEVHRITEEVGFVEVRRRAGVACHEWKVKVWPAVCALLRNPK